MINLKTSSRYKINRKKIKDFAQNYLLSHGFSLDFIVNIIFVGKNKMQKLCHTYKKENHPLPVLSFFYNEKYEDQILLGEIFICYPQAILLAAERNKTVDNLIIELVQHGINNLINFKS
jgi:rRNA maturation RNase YbeY